ncbi:hypothetical protein BDY17DRAFT_309524 [Neohortaea acidophila]|uniref:Uncharacterized protein n=1 Tax=Neohortaea acidophila TaxID=245834 RepID=A0A6A6PVS2_9PEZI|nr:uncharacterized protein BDY17DRAFT_309524 [Neohortaea acidophila]KAF2484240.1 hypothetical protein BDY17DRAFT_309524 [Neohortaea acidophila]
MRLALALMALAAAASHGVDARKMRHHRKPKDGYHVVAATAFSTGSSATGSAPSTATITPTPVMGPSTGTTCMPSTVCVDGFTCGVRYGGCYDKNYCDGTTSSFSVPTCSSSPSSGLTAKKMNPLMAKLEHELEQEAAAAAARKEQR